MRFFALLLFFLISQASWGQNTPRLMENIPFTIGNQQPSQYFEGGFNNPIFAPVDLDRDGDLDLVILEKSEGRLYGYENGGSPNQVDYVRNDDLIREMPQDSLTHFLHFADVNCDGVPDAFTYTPNGGAGIGLYLGRWVNNRLDLKLYINRLYDASPTPRQIYADQSKKPEFTDVNGDGDIDIILFGQFDGTIEWYENQQIENGGPCDTVIFLIKGNCWGEICECSLITNDITLNYSSAQCFGLWNPQHNQQERVDDNGKDTSQPGTRHAGSTLTLLDVDHDGWKEALVGDAGFDNLIFLKNNNAQTNPTKDRMVSQDTLFPKYDVPIDLPVFPAAFYLDVDNDNRKDLIVSSFGVNSCALGGSADTSYNRGNVFWYKNIGTPTRDSFQLVTRNFLVENMVDFGHITRPAWLDYNYDGLLDLVVGRCYAYDTNRAVQRGLVLLENVGTLQQPSFTYRDENFGLFGNRRWFGLSPAFGDLDSDGDYDAVLGESDGYVYILENTAGVNNPPVFVVIDTLINSSFPTPQIIDINDDSRPDLVIGGLQGRLAYWQNTGLETDPAFTQAATFFGEVDGRNGDFFGFTEPWLGDLDGDGHLEALVGTNSGAVFHYDQLEQALPSLPWKLVDSNYLDHLVGRLSGLDLADINGDGYLEIAVGNDRGGLAVFTTGFPVATDPEPVTSHFNVYPNPASDWLTIVWRSDSKAPVQLQVWDIMGRLQYQSTAQLLRQQMRIPIKDWSTGLYVLQWRQGEQQQTVKVIVE